MVRDLGQEYVAKMRHMVQKDRTGRFFPEARSFAFGDGPLDTKFCKDAAKCVDLLLGAKRTIAKPFLDQLTDDEAKDVVFLRRATAMTQPERHGDVLGDAAMLWSEYAKRNAYGLCEKPYPERRNKGADVIWQRYALDLTLDEAEQSWAKVDLCVSEIQTAKEHLAFGALIRFLTSDHFWVWKKLAAALISSEAHKYHEDDDDDDSSAENNKHSFSAAATTARGGGGHHNASEATQVKTLMSLLDELQTRVPQSAEAWLGTLTGLADEYPLCIVVSDVAIPGAPMVYVNKEFCRVTGYERAEVIGRNCRLLQGPETEADAIDVLQSTLAQQEGSHVLITNYKKNGDVMKNLLTMAPVIDGNGFYRYVVGVPFQVDDEQSSLLGQQRLLRLGSFLHHLPSRLPYASGTTATNAMLRAAATSRTANAREYLEQRARTIGPDYDGAWLTDGPATIDKLLRCSAAAASRNHQSKKRQRPCFFIDFFETFLRDYTSGVAKRLRKLITALDIVLDKEDHLVLDDLAVVRDDDETSSSREDLNFLLTALRCSTAYLASLRDQSPPSMENAPTPAPRPPGGAPPPRAPRSSTQRKLLALRDAVSTSKLMHLSPGARLVKAIAGVMQSPRKAKLCSELTKLRESALASLTSLVLEPFLMSAHGKALIDELHRVEMAAAPRKDDSDDLTTALRDGKGTTGAFSDLFAAIGEALGPQVGFVAADARCPGLPLVHVSSGFTNMTKYTFDDAVGKNCRFLQHGASRSSQRYLVEELAANIRSRRTTMTKLENFTRHGQGFQCLVILWPVKSTSSLAYFLGLQLKVDTPPRLAQDLVRADHLLDHIPSTTTGLGDVWDTTAKLPSLVNGWLSSTCCPGDSSEAAIVELVVHSSDPKIRSQLCQVAKKKSILCEKLLQFYLEMEEITTASDRRGVLRRLALRIPANPLFMFSSLEIELGAIDRMDWAAAFRTLETWRRGLYPAFIHMMLPVATRVLADQPLSSSLQGDQPKSQTPRDVAQFLLFGETSFERKWIVSMQTATLPIALGTSINNAFHLVCTNPRFDTITNDADEDILSEAVRTAVVERTSLQVLVEVKGQTCVCVVEPTVDLNGNVAIFLCGWDEKLPADLETVATLVRAWRPNIEERVPETTRRTSLQLIFGSPSDDSDDDIDRRPTDSTTISSGGKKKKFDMSDLLLLAQHHTDQPAPLLQSRKASSGRQSRKRSEEETLMLERMAQERRLTAGGAPSPSLQTTCTGGWIELSLEDRRKRMMLAFTQVLGPPVTPPRSTDGFQGMNPLPRSPFSRGGATIQVEDDHQKKLREDLVEAAARHKMEVLEIEKQHHAALEALDRQCQSEMADLERRQLDEAQRLVDKVAEAQKMKCCTPVVSQQQGGPPDDDDALPPPMFRAKHITCTCVEPYTCIHNRQALTVVVSPTDEDAVGRYLSSDLPTVRSTASQMVAAKTAKDAVQKAADRLLAKHDARKAAIAQKYTLTRKSLEEKHLATRRVVKAKCDADLRKIRMKLI